MSSVSLDSSPNDLRALSNLNRSKLAKRWAEMFGCPAPRRTHAQLLRSALAWRYQLDREAEQVVNRLILRLCRQSVSPAPTPVLSPGTRLLREWHGVTHHVAVTAEGFEYGGKHYRSLTAISREITGTAWSGPSFFGVRK